MAQGGLVEQGFEDTLQRVDRGQPPVEKLLTGEQEARIIAMRLGPPPKARSVPGSPHRFMLHAEARQLVEHRRKRIEFPHAPVCLRPPFR